MGAVEAKNSRVCVGLDPRLERLPKCVLEAAVKECGETLEAVEMAFYEFGKGIIDATHEHAAALKPQLAFFEQYGSHGLRAYERLVAYARTKNLLVIADAKRGDIGSTAAAYSAAFLGEASGFDSGMASPFAANSVTVNAYLGGDGVKPFVQDCHDHGKGIFILVKTSNPSSGDLQDRVTKDEEMPIHELMAHFVDSWGGDLIGEKGYSSVGAVVGATYPGELEKLRALMPQTLFLVPGYGAQGGGAKDVAAAFDDKGLGAVVNSSRGIIFAYEKSEGPEDGSHYKEAAGAAAEAMKEDLNSVL